MHAYMHTMHACVCWRFTRRGVTWQDVSFSAGVHARHLGAGAQYDMQSMEALCNEARRAHWMRGKMGSDQGDAILICGHLLKAL